MKAPLLLLWDIDGTLIASSGAGLRALELALGQVFGLSGSLADIDYAGRTDRWILRQIFAKHGLAATPENFDRYVEGYLAALPAQLLHPAARVLPGVAALVAEAGQRSGVAQGLLTGNLRRGAEAKLRHFGLWDFFPFGAFADDSEDRCELGPHALSRAGRHHRVEAFEAERVWVIGDTPHDISCGRAIGARTLALATGQFSTTALASHGPTALLPDLADHDAFWRMVGN